MSLNNDLTEAALKCIEKYPDRIPVFVQPAKSCKLPLIKKTKYLIPYDFTVAQFMNVLRKNISLKPSQALFIFINNQIVPPTFTFGTIKNNNNKPYIYIEYNEEDTYG